MNYLYVALPALCASLLGCRTPTALETEYSCDGQEQNQASYLHGDPQRTIRTKYPIAIDFHVRRKQVLIKTYVADIVADDGDRLLFSLQGGNNWLKGQFDKRDQSLSFLTRQTLQMGQESMDTQLSGQYVCRVLSAGS